MREAGVAGTDDFRGSMLRTNEFLLDLSGGGGGGISDMGSGEIELEPPSL